VSREVGSSLLMVTHNPADAAQTDRVLFMKDGRIHPEASLSSEAVSRTAVDERLSALGI
jgi:ABC-type lipoprotein export system ATPase subunit